MSLQKLWVKVLKRFSPQSWSQCPWDNWNKPEHYPAAGNCFENLGPVCMNVTKIFVTLEIISRHALSSWASLCMRLANEIREKRQLTTTQFLDVFFCFNQFTYYVFCININLYTVAHGHMIGLWRRLTKQGTSYTDCCIVTFADHDHYIIEHSIWRYSLRHFSICLLFNFVPYYGCGLPTIQ